MAIGKQWGGMNPRPSNKSESSRGRTVVKSVVSAGPSKATPYSPQPSPQRQNVPTAPTMSPKGLSISPAPQQVSNNVSNGLSNFMNIINRVYPAVSTFAIINDDVFQHNISLASGNNMSPSDRTISFECIDYVLSNFAFILMGLVVDSNFKQAFLDSVMLELQLDEKSPEEVKMIRATMTDANQYESMGSVVLGVTTFLPEIEDTFMQRLSRGFELLTPYSGEFDSEVEKLGNAQKLEYGFIFSNFMYLIRAFTHNDKFMAYVITVIEKVKALTVNAN